MKIAIDTNVLAYAEGLNDAQKRAIALELLNLLPQQQVFIPVQALGELFNVLVRKAKRTPTDARNSILAWQDHFTPIGTEVETLHLASELAASHQLGIWDAIILSAAARAGCRILLSEDLQHGFTWSGTTVINPFISPRHPLLDACLHPGPLRPD